MKDGDKHMELEKLSNLELLELYKEERAFTEYLEKQYEQAKKEIEEQNE